MLYTYVLCFILKFYPVKCVFDLSKLARNYIIENASLYKKILMYEPILLDELLLPLQSINVKVKKNALMDFMDTQGITYRTRSTKQNNENKRRKKERQYKRLGKMNSTLTKWQKKRLLRNERRRLRYAARKNKTLQTKTCPSNQIINKNTIKRLKTRKPTKSNCKCINLKNTFKKQKLDIIFVPKQNTKAINGLYNISIELNEKSNSLCRQIDNVINHCVTRKKRKNKKKQSQPVK